METQTYRRDLWTRRGKERVGWTKRVALTLTLYHVEDRQPAAICWMMQGAQPSALWQPRGVGWGGRWEGRVKRAGTHLWLICVDVWQKPTQYCKAIVLQFKINLKKIFLNNWGKKLNLENSKISMFKKGRRKENCRPRKMTQTTEQKSVWYPKNQEKRCFKFENEVTVKC